MKDKKYEYGGICELHSTPDYINGFICFMCGKWFDSPTPVHITEAVACKECTKKLYSLIHTQI